MTESRPYPRVRTTRYSDWSRCIDALDAEYSQSMMLEVWSASSEARLVRNLKIALDDIVDASGYISPFGFVDFSPAPGPHGEDELRGATLIDHLVQVTGIPKSRIVISGETFNNWSRSLHEASTKEANHFIKRSPAGCVLNATSALGRLNRSARDYIHATKEYSSHDSRPRLLSQTRHEIIELCGDDEGELRNLVENVERITGIKAEFF